MSNSSPQLAPNEFNSSSDDNLQQPTATIINESNFEQIF